MSEENNSNYVAKKLTQLRSIEYGVDAVIVTSEDGASTTTTPNEDVEDRFIRSSYHDRLLSVLEHLDASGFDDPAELEFMEGRDGVDAHGIPTLEDYILTYDILSALAARAPIGDEKNAGV